MIYSHGNSSDLGQSVKFVTGLAAYHEMDYLVYDYTGYGVSKIPETSEDKICKDL